MDSSLLLPEVTSDIENECIKVAKGLADIETVLKNAIETFRAKFGKFCGRNQQNGCAILVVICQASRYRKAFY